MSTAEPLPEYRDPQPHRNLDLYRQLVSDGIADADRRGVAVDHITARRISLLLISQSNDQQFTRGLTRLARDGAITQDLRKRLRAYARAPGHPHQPQAARLLQYAAARGTDLGPIGPDFAAACDQLDRADITRASLRTRNANPATAHKPRHPEPGRQQSTGTGRHDPASAGRAVEDTTATAAIHANGVSAAHRQARTAAKAPDLDPPDLDPPDLEPSDSEWPEPEWPDPAWPGFAPGGRPPSYAFTLAASPWFKERYPDKAANLWDALHVGRAPQPDPAPDRLADWEAGE